MKRNKRRLPIPQHEFGLRPTPLTSSPRKDWTATALPANATRQTAPAPLRRKRRRRCSHHHHANADTMNTNNNESPFGAIVYTYTRAHAVADGFQVDVTKTALEAGIRFPVFLTRAVYDAYVTVPLSVTAQDEAGRLWDVIPST